MRYRVDPEWNGTTEENSFVWLPLHSDLAAAHVEADRIARELHCRVWVTKVIGAYTPSVMYEGVKEE